MRLFLTVILFQFSFIFISYGQSAMLKGQLLDEGDQPVVFANVLLNKKTDSTLVKVVTTDETGIFTFQNIPPSTYFLTASYVGYADLYRTDFVLEDGEIVDVGVLQFTNSGVELGEVTVTAARAMVEVKPDRTVFNVQGTINSTGANAIELLRKAPNVNIDNNDNINVLGRAGVMVYVDGKRLPLSGEDLKSYLQSLTADQIDRIDIITNPGAKYEAQGNAGIIDIRLKKDKNLGANGSLNSTFTRGRQTRYNLGGNGNYRNKLFNAFVSASYGDNENFNEMDFQNFQNNLYTDETNNGIWGREWLNVRAGVDFFIHKNHTIGVLADIGNADFFSTNLNRITIAPAETRNLIDSILVADNQSNGSRDRQSYNLNYRFDNQKGQTLNIDLDYGRFENQSFRDQPNLYYNADETLLLSSVLNSFETPTNISIFTAKIDFEKEILGGKLGLGAKLSDVTTDNTFLVFDGLLGSGIQNNSLSNEFFYDEMVTAGYFSYSRVINKKWNFSAGLRAEQSDIKGELLAFLPELQEPPVELSYLSWFPSAGLTYQAAPNHSFSLNYGRRINRPDYNVLNPFNNRLSELSFEKGNPFLRPEIVNNIELGYTYAYRFNFKLGYSKTNDQITRLIAPDEIDPRASFISWDNLASQTIYSFSASLPFDVTKWWNAYINFGASHLNNQADYGDGAVIDLQAFTYNVYQQHTFKLPWKLRGEVSSWLAGPGIWGGVFEYNTQWALNVGLQRKFLKDQLQVRLSANDLFFTSGWDGMSVFNGLVSSGGGRWDSRNVSVNVTYNFGNQNVKSRKRKTGLEKEASRIGN